MKYARVTGAVLATTVLTVAVLSTAHGQQIHRNGFESPDAAWIKGTADVAFRELIHDVTDASAHTGQSAEHVQIATEQGSYVYYYYPVGKAPLSEELSATIWIKANRPGIQLLARLVLPKERNPNNLDEPLTTLLRGDLYQTQTRWQRLELRRPSRLAKQQQQIMRTQLQRDVDFTDAYIDRLVLNLYAGPGPADVLIDDLEVGPVTEITPFQTTSRSAGSVKLQPVRPALPAPTRAGLVELEQNHLLVNHKYFFMRGIRHSDTPLKALRDAGFNTVWFDHNTSPAQLEEAINLGFWLVPSLPVAANDSGLVSSDQLRQEITRFLEKDSVLFWDVGGGLTDEQSGLIAKAASIVRTTDPQHPIGADAWDGFRPYSRNLDLLGAHRWPLLTGLELPQYYQWLSQRRRLARSGSFMWTWVQTHLPDWYTTLVYERPSSAAGFNEPIGPQPEQIRLLTYVALAAGCRGLGFWSDRFLADSHQGRDRLLTLALLNLELRMLEPLLVRAEDPTWIDTSHAEVKAALFRTERGLLVIPMWLGKGAQFVPGQSAAAKLTLTVPQAPAGTQAWEVSPADVHCLQMERVPGGTRITIPEFGLTTAIIFTGDNGPGGIVVNFQNQVRQHGRTAAQWAHDLAEEAIVKVSKIEEQLVKAAHPIPDGQQLLDDARKRVRTCTDLWNKGDYREAYGEAQRALRPLRIMMRAQWEEATRDLGVAVASPYAVSFYTLPRHWQFMEQFRQAKFGGNVLAGGDFEVRPDQVPDSWTLQQTTLDEVDMAARRVTDNPKEGRQCLMLHIAAKNALLPPVALERTFLAINSPSVRLAPGTLVRVSGWVRIPATIAASADGALLYDSAGGEPLAVRLTEATTWKQFILYRKVPSSGTMSVTLALTGIGKVYFDDVRIEPVATGSIAARPNQ
jgi:hypothetical protein